MIPAPTTDGLEPAAVATVAAPPATKVGGDAYAAKLAEEASKFTLVHSELRSGIDKILKFITRSIGASSAASIAGDRWPGRMSFSATTRPSRSSRARYTAAIPPTPTSFSSRYPAASPTWPSSSVICS